MKPSSFLLLITLCFTLACSNEQPTILELFPRSLKIGMHETALNCAKVGTPSDMFITDSLLIVMDYYHKTILSLIDLNSFTHLMHFGPRGNGPGEINSAICLGKLRSDDEFYIFDDMPRKFKLFSIDSLLTTKRRTSFSYRKLSAPTGLYQALLCYDSLMIATINSPTHHYGLFDRKGDLVESFGNYPTPPNDSEFPELANPLTFQCALALNPNRRSFVSVGFKSGFFEIFNIENNEITNVFNFHPKFPSVLPDITKTSRSVASLPDNIYGFIDIDVSEEFIYSLYSGRTIQEYSEDAYYSNHVLVFDWQGQPIIELQLDVDITTIAIDEINQTIYGFAEFPELKLFKAILPDMLFH